MVAGLPNYYIHSKVFFFLTNFNYTKVKYNSRYSLCTILNPDVFFFRRRGWRWYCPPSFILYNYIRIRGSRNLILQGWYSFEILTKICLFKLIKNYFSKFQKWRLLNPPSCLQPYLYTYTFSYDKVDEVDLNLKYSPVYFGTYIHTVSKQSDWLWNSISPEFVTKSSTRLGCLFWVIFWIRL